jgi:O-methyltransferase
VHEEIPWDIPDKALYKPLFSPWESETWRADIRLADSRSVVSPDRQYVLERLVRQALAAVEGDVVECGVFRGGTARLFADILTRQAPERDVLLFDTFEGMPETNKEFDLHSKGDFAQTSLESVRDYLSDYTNCRFFKGRIPETFLALRHTEKYCFVHVDLDIHDAIWEASEYFYPRVPRGGFLIYDDYGFPSCPGARRAVDTFYADKPEEPLVLHTGQCLVFKSS